ncbi:hypothetical protein [Cupriavidus sp. TMH.W2]|uniref:hypothetical protein n=1 Tax=Cupriavidus sp. TMH.W2 TaxID=3434465 RepID=UPI003D77689B
MTIRRVTPEAPVTAADIGRFAFCAPSDPLALCDGPWQIAGVRAHAKVPLVDLQPVADLTVDADGATCCSPDTILFVTETRQEAKQLLALNRSQVQQSEAALAPIRARIATAVAAALRAAGAPAAGQPARAGGKQRPKKSLHERKLDAETRASRWLADGNEARERGDLARADEYYAKSQYWRDRAILLAGEGDRPAPKE